MLQDVSRTSTDRDPPAPTARARWLSRVHWLDVALGCAGSALGWASLAFPFGRDQGLYFYVAREWVARGAVPYRDVLDHKTPGIYMVHALAIRLFGENMWGIRVLELAAVLLTGLVAAALTAEPGRKPLPGVRGAAVLSAHVLFYGFLNFWDSSQSEVWYSLLGICAVWAARCIVDERRAQLSAGAFAGAAFIMKPPSVWFILIALMVLAARTWGERPALWRARALALVRFGAGSAAVVAPILAYFALKGAWPAMMEIVVRSNARYAQLERGAMSVDDVTRRLLDFFGIYNFVSPLLAFGLVFGLGFAVGRGDRALRDRHLIALALIVGGFAAVIMQMKFYLLHYGVLLGPATVICANLAADCGELAPRLRGRSAAPLAFVALFLAAWSQTHGWERWRSDTLLVASYLRGYITRHQFTSHFAFPEIGFSYEDSEAAGLWLRDHSRKNDTVVVRGFEPQLYAVARRRCPGRFFWSVFLTSGTRGDPEMLARWNEEDRRTIEEQRPRFAVARTGLPEGPDSPNFFLARGYRVQQVINEFTILERTDSLARAPGPSSLR